MDFSKAVIGIEFGSTRIKAVLLDEMRRPFSQGSYEWENEYKEGVWTYSYDRITEGLQTCFADLKAETEAKTGEKLTKVGAIGISAMMHGYLPLDRDGKPLAEFRTWRNTMTGEAAEELTALFNFNIPQRWSIAHLYQAMLKGEEHLPNLAHLTTLAGYIHWKLTGLHGMGVGEASGMFPIGEETGSYDAGMMEKFNALAKKKGYDFTLEEILPKVLSAGENAGYLTKEGALLLDPTGTLEAGIPLCPCEGDAGTGMTATNSVRVRTGNVSAGTSDFAMVVTDRPLGVHREIDMVTTPDGSSVAMVHCNNCTSDINAWVGLFAQFAEAIGAPQDKGQLFTLLFRIADQGAKDGGGLMDFNYFSGEGVTGFDEGRPLFMRIPGAQLDLATFMRVHLMSALATLKIGLDILKEENVTIDKLYGHGGFFKTPGVGQRMLSAAAGVPVSVMETAGEGGPYGMALLAAYMLEKEDGEALPDYLDEKVFGESNAVTLMADPADVEGFSTFLTRYKKALAVEQAAVESLYE